MMRIQEFHIQPYTLVVATIMTIITVINDFVEAWVWNPASAIWFMGALFISDWITGVLASVIKRNEGFKSYAGWPWVFKFTGTLILLGVLYNLPKADKMFGTNNIDVEASLMIFAKFIYWVMATYQLGSIMKNMAILRVLPTPIAKFAIKYIDRYKDFFTPSDINKDKND